VLHEEAASPISALRPPRAGEIVLVVGPEGGITDEELAAFAAAGAGTVRLGPTVLRTSTAGVAATSVLMAATGRW
jgi:16S rRNA (uracil1498-N3)-methyltransferase